MFHFAMPDKNDGLAKICLNTTPGECEPNAMVKTR
jgi:hypothetical protein